MLSLKIDDENNFELIKKNKMKDLKDAKLKKYHSGVKIVNDKFVYFKKPNYKLDREMNNIFNSLSEEEMMQLLLDFEKFQKNFEKILKNFNIDNIDLDKIKKLTSYKTPLLSKICDLSELHFPFTDYRNKHVLDLILNNINDQLMRRKLRILLGEKKAKQYYPEYFLNEFIKPKNMK